MGKHVNLSGVRFGRLVVKSYVGRSRWLCVCDCGGESQPVTGALTSGNTKSCGCRKRSVLGESTTKHGRTGTKIYQQWKGIRARCLNPKNARYSDYGGRGITICERWQKFENFYADVGDPPSGMSLDRIDNNKGYSPDNCRWVPAKDQNLNKRNTLRVNGVPLKLIAAERGISYSSLYYRLTHGLPI